MTFDLFPPLFCALSLGAASLFEGLLWVRAHFRGSCGSVRRYGPFLRLLRSTWALSCVVDVGSGMAHRSATLKMRRSPTSAILIPGNGSARQRSSWWSSSLAKGLRDSVSVSDALFLRERSNQPCLQVFDKNLHHQLVQGSTSSVVHFSRELENVLPCMKSPQEHR